MITSGRDGIYQENKIQRKRIVKISHFVSDTLPSNIDYI
jgi:hypothetical protein